jgi:hypothetical protein
LGVGVMLASGDLSYMEAALDEGIAALRRSGLTEASSTVANTEVE